MADQINKNGKGDAKPPRQGPMRVPLTLKERAEKTGPGRSDESITLPAAGICEKLDDLRKRLPGRSDAVYEFGAMLSRALSQRQGNGAVSPHDFIIATDTLIMRLVESGGDEDEGRIEAAFARCTPLLFMGVLPAITGAVTTPEFAQHVASIRHEMKVIEDEFDLDME